MYEEIPGDGVNTNTTKDNEENTVDTGLDSNLPTKNQVQTNTENGPDTRANAQFRTFFGQNSTSFFCPKSLLFFLPKIASFLSKMGLRLG